VLIPFFPLGMQFRSYEPSAVDVAIVIGPLVIG